MTITKGKISTNWAFLFRNVMPRKYLKGTTNENLQHAKQTGPGIYNGK